MSNGFTSSTGSACCQLASVGPWPRLNKAAPSVQLHYRDFIDGSLALASLNLACRYLVPAFPQRSPPLLLTTAACGGLRSTPDCRPRRTSLSYSCASPFGPAILVTQDPTPTSAACGALWLCLQRKLA